MGNFQQKYFLCVTLKESDFLWVTLKQKQPTVGSFLPKQPTVGNLETFTSFCGCLRPGGVEDWIVHHIFQCIDCYWWLRNTQRVNANVTDIHDNEESPQHILLSTHSV